MSKFNPFRGAKQFLLKPDDEDVRNVSIKVEYICASISRCLLRKATTQHDIHLCRKAKDLIMRRLGAYSYVDTWLEAHLKVPKKHLTFQNIQAYRHRWLDHLADEYDAGRLIL